MESKLTWAAISTSSIAVQGWMVSFIQATFALLRSTCQPLAHRSSSRAFETLSAARSSSGLSPGHSAGLKASATSVTKGGGRKLAALLLRPYLPDTCFKVSGMGAVMAHGFLAGIMMCVALVSPAVGQDRAQRRGSLTGFVRDTSGQPLPLVLVTVALDTPRIGITDSAGAYRLDGIPPGVHRVTLRRIGFQPAEFSLLVDPDVGQRVTIELVAASGPIDSILIIGRTIHTELAVAGFYDRMRAGREGA